MGRLELKLLALLVLVAGLPLLVALLLSGVLFERSLAVGLDTEVSTALEASVEVFQEFIRAEKGRQKAVAHGLAQSATMRDLVAAQDRHGLERHLTRVLADPRALSVEITFADEQTPPLRVATRIQGLTAAGVTFRKQTVERPIGDPPVGALRFTYGLEHRFFERFAQMDNEVIAPYSALNADRENLADLYTWGFIGSLSATVLAASLLAVFIGRRTTRRLSDLRAAMGAVAEGALDTRIPPSGRDEVADLARHFNHMADRLEDSYARVQYLTQVSAWQGIARRLAHEIKNPLTPILLSVQQAHSGYKGDDPRFTRTLNTTREIVEQEVETLRRLVEEFSQFARLPTVQPEATDLGALAQELVAAHPQVPGLEARIPEEPVMARVDRGLLRQVLTNLVINAGDAVSEREGAGQVHVLVALDGAHVTLWIDDDGPGVPEDQRARIFDPYVTGKAHGTGLGLAIVKKVILDHGGRIDVHTSPLGGARFELRLPVDGPSDGALPSDPVGSPAIARAPEVS